MARTTNLPAFSLRPPLRQLRLLRHLGSMDCRSELVALASPWRCRTIGAAPTMPAASTTCWAPEHAGDVAAALDDGARATLFPANAVLKRRVGRCDLHHRISHSRCYYLRVWKALMSG